MLGFVLTHPLRSFEVITKYGWERITGHPLLSIFLKGVLPEEKKVYKYLIIFCLRSKSRAVKPCIYTGCSLVTIGSSENGRTVQLHFIEKFEGILQLWMGEGWVAADWEKYIS